MNTTETECKNYHWRGTGGAGFMLLAVSGALLLLAMFFSELKAYQFIGRDVPGEMTTINVTGEGRAFATPDIAIVNFSVVQESKTQAEAREIVDGKMRDILAFLKESGIEEKDIKTTGYNLYPKYEWQESRVVCITYPCPQPPGKQVLLGYEVSQSVEVKVRKIDDAGKVVGGLAEKGATNMYGPSFTVDEPESVRAEARKEAIEKAKAKAEQLADDLGVDLVRIVSFSEGGVYPYAYGRGGGEKLMAQDAYAPVPAELPVGENEFNSSVTLVYEVR